MEKNNLTKGQLERTFEKKDIFALAFGTMVGWGWIMLSGKWASDAGFLGAILAYIIGAIMCVFVGLVYAELTSAIPYTGGCVVYAYKSMGYWPAIFVGLASAFSYIGVASWEGPAFVMALDYIVPIKKVGKLWTIQGCDVYISTVLLTIFISSIIIYLNYKGAKQTAILQKVATLGLIGVGILFLTGGILKGKTEYVEVLFTDLEGFSSVLLMVPAMFVGFDVVPQSASEMNVPLKKIPKILISTIFAAAFWYILMIAATCISAPPKLRVNGNIPVADTMSFSFGNPIWGKICIVGAICGILTSWNGFLYGAARVIYSLANAKMLPAFLGKIHPKYKTPYNAVLFCGIISTFSCLLGTGALTWFVNASSFGVVIVYLMASLSFIKLRKNNPELKRPYKVKNGNFVGVMAVVISIFFMTLYFPIGPSPLTTVEWALVAGWFLIGFIFAIYARLKNSDSINQKKEINNLKKIV